MDESMAIVSDIESLLAQLKQLESGEAQGQPDEGNPEVQMDDGMLQKILKYMKAAGGEEDGEEKKDEKEEVAKSDEGPNASDTAETRVDGQGEVKEKNVSEVAKAVAKLLSNKMAPAKVQKSAPSLDKIYKSLEILVDRVSVQDKVLKNILEGLNVSDQVMKSVEVAPVQKAEVNNDEVQRMMSFIRKSLDQAQEEKPVDQADFSLRKALTENDGMALKAMMTTKNRIK